MERKFEVDVLSQFSGKMRVLARSAEEAIQKAMDATFCPDGEIVPQTLEVEDSEYAVNETF